MDDVRGEIAKLEERIERLNESLEWCRKIAIASKSAIALGAVLLLAMLTGFITTQGLQLILTTILLLGGIVLSGSNATTAEQTAGKIAEAERLRAELIGEIELTLVPEVSRTLH